MKMSKALILFIYDQLCRKPEKSNLSGDHVMLLDDQGERVSELRICFLLERVLCYPTSSLHGKLVKVEIMYSITLESAKHSYNFFMWVMMKLYAESSSQFAQSDEKVIHKL